MAIVYRTTDRIAVKIGELVVKISPLTKYQKERIQGLSLDEKYMRAAAEAIKCGIKDIEGVSNADGSQYKLQFDENNELTEECVDDLMNLGNLSQISTVCNSLLEGIPKEFVNPYTQKKLEGVEFVKVEEAPRKKSKS